MGLERSGLSIGVVAATAVALLLLTPATIPRHLEEPGHDHEDSPRVAIEAVHTTLPAHFDASSTTGERLCSACLLQGRTVVRSALVPGAEFLPPVVSLGPLLDPRRPVKPQSRLDLSRAPPTLI